MTDYISDDYKEDRCFGGIARIFTKIKEIRDLDPDRTLVFHAGDFFQGTIW